MRPLYVRSVNRQPEPGTRGRMTPLIVRCTLRESPPSAPNSLPSQSLAPRCPHARHPLPCYATASRPGTGTYVYRVPLIKSLNPDSSVFFSSLSRSAANPSCPSAAQRHDRTRLWPLTTRHSVISSWRWPASTSPALIRPTTIDPPGHVTLPSADAGLCDCCCSRVRIP